MSRDIIKQLKQIKNHPDTGWVNSIAENESRNKLMQAIGHNEDRVVEDSQGAFLQWNFMQTAVRPVGMMVLMFAFVFGGWFTSAKAASNSLPGDTLYSLKIVTEQAQLFITSDDDRAVLHTQFAQRRLLEVQALQDIGDARASQYLVEAVHALETEIVKAGDALAQMKLDGNENTLIIASVLDEKIGAINAELSLVNDQEDAIDAVQLAVGEVAEDAVDLIVETHEEDETQESAIAIDRSFKNEYTNLRSRQSFDLGRVATIRLVVEENSLQGVVTRDELLHIEFIIKKATEDVADAMNFVAAGGYRAAFDILREADEALLIIETQLVEIESSILTEMNAPEEIIEDEIIDEDQNETQEDEILIDPIDERGEIINEDEIQE